MNTSTWTSAFVLAFVFALHATAHAEPKIGSASATKDQVEGVLGGKSRGISAGSEVYSNEVVRTGRTGVADLIFLDNTNLSVGPISEVRLDKFVYDPSGPNGAVVLQVTKGAFRFVTGKQDSRAYSIKTPYGTLGVRGTIVEIKVTDEPCTDAAVIDPNTGRRGCMQVKLVEGGAEVTNNAGDSVWLTEANTMVSVNASGVISGPTSAPGTILNFASLGSGDITGSIPAGSGGAAGGQTAALGAQGGGNAGASGGGSTSVNVSSGSTLQSGGVGGGGGGGGLAPTPVSAIQP